jgi:hypothetical protein
LLAAETFMNGENWPRARIVVEYAQSRLDGKSSKGKGKGDGNSGGQSLRSPRWLAVLRALSWHAEQDEVAPAVRAAIEAEFVATMDELKKSRETMGKVEGVLKAANASAAASTKAAKKPAAASSKVGTPPPSPPLAKNGDKNGDKNHDKNAEGNP